MGFVIRSCHSFRKPDTMILLYNSFVRSKLEFTSTVWHGRTAAQVDSLERVQKKFLRYIYYRRHGIYPHYSRHPVRTRELQNEFDFLSLQNRRELTDVLFLHKLCNNLIDCPDLLSAVNLHFPDRVLRNTGKTIFYSPVETRVRLISPIRRLENLYNDLNVQLDLDLSMSLTEIKRSVTEFYSSNSED